MIPMRSGDSACLPFADVFPMIGKLSMLMKIMIFSQDLRILFVATLSLMSNRYSICWRMLADLRGFPAALIMEFVLIEAIG